MNKVFKKVQKYRWVVIIAVFLTISVYSVSYYAKNELRNLLANYTRELSSGDYELKYEFIELKLLKRSVVVHKATLSPVKHDSLPIREKNTYHISLDKMEINLNEVITIYTEKKLHVEGIDVQNPVILLNRLPGEEKRFTVDIGNLYLLISDYIEVLEVDYLRINGGEFIDSSTKRSIKDFDFSLSNITIDSLSSASDQFYSDDLKLKVRAQTFLLPDSIHNFSFGELSLSTLDSVLSFQDVHISPLSGEIRDECSRIDIQLEHFDLKGIDYVKAYRENILKIDKTDIESPQIKITNLCKSNVENPVIEEILFNLFKSHSLEILNLRNAYLEINSPEDTIKIEKINTVFHGLELDSSNWVEDNWLFALDIDADNFSYNHTSGLNILLNNVISSSSQKNLNISGIDLTPPNSSRHRFHAKNLNFYNTDIIRSYHNRSMAAGLTKINGMELLAGGNEKFGKIDREKFLENLAKYIAFFKSDSLVVQDANISLPSLNLIDFNLHTAHFNVFPAMTSFDSLLNNETLSAKFEFSQNPYTFQGVINYHHDKPEVKINEMKLTHNHHDSSKLSLQELIIHGTRLNEYLADTLPRPDSVSLINPTLLWTLDPYSTPEESGETHFLSNFGKINIDNGSLTVFRGNSSLKTDSMNTSLYIKNDILRVQNISSNHLLYRSGDTLLSVAKILYDSTKSNIQISDLNYSFPDIKFTIPSASFINWDQYTYFTENKIAIDSMVLSNPSLRGMGPVSLVPGENNLENESLALGFIHIDNGTLEYSFHTNSDTIDVKIDHVNSELENVSDLHAFLSNKNLLYGENLRLSVGPGSIYSSKHQILINSFDFFQKDDEFSVSGLRYSSKTDSLSIRIDKGNGTGPDLVSLINNDVLEMECLQIDGGEFVYSESGIDQKTEAFTLKNISIDQAEIGNYFFSIKKQNHTPFILYETDLSVSGLNYSPEWDFHNIADDLRIRAKNFSYPLDGGNYTVKVARFDYHHSKGAFLFENVSLESFYDKLAYSKTIDHQKDWFHTTSDTVIVQINPDSYLDSVFHIKKINIKGLKGEIFRDKHLTIDSNHIVALPQNQLRRLDLPLKIDTTEVQGIISYSERPKESETFARIDFTDLKGIILNVTTRDYLYEKPMYLRASGNIFKDARFTAAVRLNMSEPDAPFQFRGYMGEMDLQVLNNLLRPVADTEIRSGKGIYANFVFEGNEEVATGQMEFKYEDLKVNVLNSGDTENRRFSKNLMTFFANSFIVRKKNPRAFKFRKGLIFFERDKNRSIFSFWGKAIMSGSVSSVGINKNKRSFSRYLKRIRKKKD